MSSFNEHIEMSCEKILGISYPPEEEHVGVGRFTLVCGFRDEFTYLPHPENRHLRTFLQFYFGSARQITEPSSEHLCTVAFVADLHTAFANSEGVTDHERAIIGHIEKAQAITLHWKMVQASGARGAAET